LHNKIGYFNMAFNKYGEEDADFGSRVRSIGLQMGYLKENGIHLGEGDNDTGEYRKFKDECRQKNLAIFKQHVAGYYNGTRSVFIPFDIKPHL
jgi:hypothetical protein